MSSIRGKVAARLAEARARSLRAVLRSLSAERGEPGSLGTDALAITLMLSLLADPASLMRMDQETRLRIARRLAARPPRRDAGRDAGGRPDPRDMAAVLGEFMMASFASVLDDDVSQLDRARDAGERLAAQARRLSPRAAEQVTVLMNTAFEAVTGIERTKEFIPLGREAESHAGTIEVLRRRIDALPPGDPNRDRLRPTLALMLSGQAVYLRETDPGQARGLLAEAETLADLDHARGPAAAMLRQALDHARSVLDDAGPAPVPMVLPGKSVREVRDRLRRAGFAPEALREVLADEEIPVWERVTTGFDAAFQALADFRLERSLACAEQSVDLLDRIIGRDVDAVSAEHAIAALVGGLPTAYVSGLLAGLHAEAGSPVSQTLTGPLVDRAAVLAERSRGLLLARQLEGRADLDELRAAHPGLAARYETLTAVLDADPESVAALLSAEDPPGAGREEWARLAKFRAIGEREELLARIRAEDGFGDFLLPLTADRLRGLADAGPVVLLNFPVLKERDRAALSSVGPFALVVTARSITSVRLDAPIEEVTSVAGRWSAAIADINARGAARPGIDRLREAAADMTAVLSWTWHRVTGPVLAAAGLPGGGDRPRIWWIPDGPFHALPLHAAQCQGEGCEFGEADNDRCAAALDLVVSSYAPGFRTLAHVRQRARLPGVPSGKPLVVAAGDAELPGAESAAREAAALLGAAVPLIGAAATRDAVAAALADVTVAHFGCHAASDPAEPSGGVLHLPSGEPLTVREVCRARPPAAWLAFLPACSTARTSRRLASEAIHLSSAFLIAGFGESVGTLWEIDSGDARQVTAEFYQRLTAQRAAGRPAERFAPGDAATVLHQCVQRLRRARPASPHIWAAYVHAGA